MMIYHPNHEKGQFHMDDQLYENIILLPDRINKNKDVVGLVSGDPGNGKSTIISQIAYVNSPSIINEGCVHNTVEQFRAYAQKLAEDKQSKGKANIHDEARESGGMNVVSSRIRIHWDYIYENRFLNMYQYFLQSDFWNTPRHIIYHRATFLIVVVEDEDWANGIFLFYGKKAMRALYERGKKYGDYRYNGFDFQGRFVNFWAGNPNYSESKYNKFMEKYKEVPKEEEVMTDKDFIFACLDRLMFPDKLNIAQFCENFGIDRSYYYKIKKEYDASTQ